MHRSGDLRQNGMVFDKARLNDKERASIALSFTQSLYKVEADAWQNELSAQQRKELRLQKSLPILNAFGKWMVEALKSREVLPKSSMGKAIAYTLGRWDNLIENTIRPVALGRKNYLFAGSHEGARRAAIFYSFFATCKVEGVNPAHWLKYVLDNIQNTKINQLENLYPKNFKELNKM